MGYLLTMTLKLSWRVMVGTLVLLVVGAAPAADRPSPFYPDGYRQWTLTRFRLQGPESPNYEKQGGFRHYYANQHALDSWGQFRDGAVIVDERVHARLNAQRNWEETGIAHVAVMLKDRKHHPDTGGWHFNIFFDGDTTTGLTADQAKARCFDACHATQEARDFVFSDPRR
ncbi:MAG TPA: cytochrome P460 family protein [Steroidobacteraceae bacterium]|nr:cytochrome P460 family protein [Steroidobacteraceae bacterium]